MAEFHTALRIQPDYGEALSGLRAVTAEWEYNQALTAAKTPGHLADAVHHFEESLRLNPNNADAESNLGFALGGIPERSPEAIRHFEAALRINPGSADAHYNLGAALSNIPGRLPEAIQHFETAYRLKPDPELERLIMRLRKNTLLGR
jgi:tetratricopeptide (TPR) repeat protein